MKIIVLPTLLALCLLLSSPAEGSEPEEHSYRHCTGASEKVFTWRLDRGDTLRLLSTDGDEEHFSVSDQDFATLRWHLTNPKANTAVVAERQGNRLRVSGTRDGQKVERSHAIDDYPWFQALSLSLRPLALGEREEDVFWTLRPDNLATHKMVARVMGTEQLMDGGNKVDAVRIEVKPTGFLGMLWSCDYWFRASDGLFLRYEGLSGPPGSDKTVVERQE